MTAALELSQVTAGYHIGEPVLKNITLRLERGEMVGILGPNGAGKTTLFRLATGLMQPARGEVRIFGEACRKLMPKRRAQLIGVAPQSLDGLIPFSVQELVAMSRSVWRSHPWQPSHAGNDQRAVDRALALTDMSDLRHRPLDALSGGERQRAIVAMAITRESPLLLLDEATSHLDMNHRLEIMQIVERLNREKGITVLMISHDINLSADFCHRILLLDHGALVADGTPSAVLRSELLEAVYHCDIAVSRDPQRGVITVNPARRLPSLPPETGVRCHVIGGGGSAGELLRRLTLSDYRVSCGVLNSGDTDELTATALDIATTTEKPFSSVSAGSLAAARRMAADCRICIIAGTPFGPGNLANLVIAEDIQQRGGHVLIMQGIERRDYTPAKQATKRVQSLLDKGAQAWKHTAQLMQQLAFITVSQ